MMRSTHSMSVCDCMPTRVSCCMSVGLADHVANTRATLK